MVAIAGKITMEKQKAVVTSLVEEIADPKDLEALDKVSSRNVVDVEAADALANEPSTWDLVKILSGLWV
jgi:hypothetical protein